MQTGDLVQWNDERGFGFIAAQDGTRYFVHISDIGRIATRPRAGDRLRFRPVLGADGRPVAKAATILGANPLPRPRPAPSKAARFVADWRYLAAGVLAGLVSLDWSTGALPDAVMLGYGGMACLSMLAYMADKTYAEDGRWRVRETTLHGLDLFGGIIGGLVAQAILRHKTRKRSFGMTTRLILALHVLVLGTLAIGLWGPISLLA